MSFLATLKPANDGEYYLANPAPIETIEAWLQAGNEDPARIGDGYLRRDSGQIVPPLLPISASAAITEAADTVAATAALAIAAAAAITEGADTVAASAALAITAGAAITEGPDTVAATASVIAPAPPDAIIPAFYAKRSQVAAAYAARLDVPAVYPDWPEIAATYAAPPQIAAIYAARPQIEAIWRAPA